MIELTLPEKIRVRISIFSRHCFVLEQLQVYFPKEYVVHSNWLMRTQAESFKENEVMQYMSVHIIDQLAHLTPPVFEVKANDI